MKKILFFDDEPMVTSYLIRNLKDNYGWNEKNKITFVSTIESLLDQMNQSDVTYDLFVLDVMAPVPTLGAERQFDQDELKRMDEGRLLGYVMAEKIRRIEKYKEVPILYLSARLIPTIPESEKGFTAYIRKPVDANEMSKKMKALLEKH